MGDEIEQFGRRPLAVELGEGGKHSAAEPGAGKGCARRLGDFLDGGLLRTPRARLPRLQVRGARHDDRIQVQARFPSGSGDGRKRDSRVLFVGDDDFEDDRRRDGFGRLPVCVELDGIEAIAEIDAADKEMGMHRP